MTPNGNIEFLSGLMLRKVKDWKQGGNYNLNYVIVAGGDRSGHSISSSKQTETPKFTLIIHGVWRAGEQGRHSGRPPAKKQELSMSLQRTAMSRHWIGEDQELEN